ncbi:prolyl 4-hydroxylase alpha subunit [Fadolivirus algeromassiliense]|jgi:prolyl 4-hydroxylase|uniref:Prolyl 4-hydroxylase alpha subunit n=1 Tax=Fadolivirus FV1/VV64 TaxID=3070911 RepID=A0A7D3UPW9_9VIRU|nr:prolyl 4-hydroxylase alpha subunit [Fadolivirus algeromassiliense]QKF94208.1 prolyl 4-hydroxylase alpha subunit [Fadolivirus FV1/VV64]
MTIDKICIIITIILLLFLLGLIYLTPIIYEHFTTPTLAYANLNDPYDKPFIINNVLTPEQCIAIVDYAKEKLFDSEVVGGKHSDIRNSMQCWIPKTDPLVKNLFERISQQFSIPFENAEDLQVVRYLPNQYYNEHHDSCCDLNDKCKEFVKRGGQRKLTILIYLNNEFEEGNTYFKNLDLKLKPKTGDAAVFHPLARNSSLCHPLALHAGLPVTRGEKWVANVWFRENKFI